MAKTQFTCGEKIGTLTFVADVPHPPKKRAALFRCHCGKEFPALVQNVKRLNTQSCGCSSRVVAAEKTRIHGRTGKRDRAYKTWAHMKSRCLNENDPKFSSYGARGISVCEKWLNFTGFLDDMGDPPDGHTLDRIDNNGSYEPGNCRWATPKQQANNRRSTRWIEAHGKRLPLNEWIKLTGFSGDFIRRRLKLGIHPDEFLFVSE